MTSKQLMAAALARKSVTGFHRLSTCRQYMPAAFLVSMPFRLVMNALPRIKEYKPKRRVKRCEYGIRGGSMTMRCPKPATLKTETGYKCCKDHAPYWNGKLREDVKAL